MYTSLENKQKEKLFTTLSYKIIIINILVYYPLIFFLLFFYMVVIILHKQLCTQLLIFAKT